MPRVTTSNTTIKPTNLGIIANEFLDQQTGRMGGFGWAAMKVAKLFREHPECGVHTTFLTHTMPSDGNDGIQIHGTPLFNRKGGRLTSVRRVRALKLDLLLMMEYRPSYRFFARALPRTPVIVWVRDPRTPRDIEKIGTLRIPGAEGIRPQGIQPIDCTSLSKIVNNSRFFRRPVMFATPSPELAARVPDTYGVMPSEVTFLPNLIELNHGEVSKSARPSVVFLGRLDPIKRPWVFVKLQSYFRKSNFFSWASPTLKEWARGIP